MELTIQTAQFLISDSTESEYLQFDLSDALADVNVSCCTCSCCCCC